MPTETGAMGAGLVSTSEGRVSVIVFTAILGGSDSLKSATTGADRCVCFTDDLSRDTRGWEFRQWAPTHNPRREAWRLRCVPHQLFADYDTVVWVDASFTVTDLPRLLADAKGHELAGLRHHARASCYDEGREIVRIGQAAAADVDAQLDAYRAVGFASDRLTIGCVLVRQHLPAVNAFNDRWLAEIERHRGDNCQVSLDYAAWASGLVVHHLWGTRKDNPYATHDHADHKRRRRPYAR